MFAFSINKYSNVVDFHLRYINKDDITYESNCFKLFKENNEWDTYIIKFDNSDEISDLIVSGVSGDIVDEDEIIKQIPLVRNENRRPCY